MKSRILLACFLTLSMASSALAVLTVTDGALVVQDETGTPLPQTKISLTFNGTTHELETDDDGAVPLVLLTDGQTAMGDEDRDGAVALIGDGEGSITYAGGPSDGETFVVKDGALHVPGAGGLSPLLTGGIISGGVLGGVVALTAGGDDNNTMPVPAATTSVPVSTSTSGSMPSPPATGGTNPSIVGNYSTNTNVVQNRALHPNDLEGVVVLRVLQQGNRASVFANDPQFIEVHGMHQLAQLSAGALVVVRVTASGNGTYRGFSTRAELDATIDTESGELTGTYSIGTDGRLPGGQPIRWSLNGRRQ